MAHIKLKEKLTGKRVLLESPTARTDDEKENTTPFVTKKMYAAMDSDQRAKVESLQKMGYVDPIRDDSLFPTELSDNEDFSPVINNIGINPFRIEDSICETPSHPPRPSKHFCTPLSRESSRRKISNTPGTESLEMCSGDFTPDRSSITGSHSSRHLSSRYSCSPLSSNISPVGDSNHSRGTKEDNENSSTSSDISPMHSNVEHSSHMNDEDILPSQLYQLDITDPDEFLTQQVGESEDELELSVFASSGLSIDRGSRPGSLIKNKDSSTSEPQQEQFHSRNSISLEEPMTHGCDISDQELFSDDEKSPGKNESLHRSSRHGSSPLRVDNEMSVQNESPTVDDWQDPNDRSAGNANTSNVSGNLFDDDCEASTARSSPDADQAPVAAVSLGINMSTSRCENDTSFVSSPNLHLRAEASENVENVEMITRTRDERKPSDIDQRDDSYQNISNSHLDSSKCGSDSDAQLNGSSFHDPSMSSKTADETRDALCESSVDGRNSRCSPSTRLSDCSTNASCDELFESNTQEISSAASEATESISTSAMKDGSATDGDRSSLLIENTKNHSLSSGKDRSLGSKSIPSLDKSAKQHSSSSEGKKKKKFTRVVIHDSSSESESESQPPSISANISTGSRDQLPNAEAESLHSDALSQATAATNTSDLDETESFFQTAQQHESPNVNHDEQSSNGSDKTKSYVEELGSDVHLQNSIGSNETRSNVEEVSAQPQEQNSEFSDRTKSYIEEVPAESAANKSPDLVRLSPKTSTQRKEPMLSNLSPIHAMSPVVRQDDFDSPSAMFNPSRLSIPLHESTRLDSFNTSRHPAPPVHEISSDEDDDSPEFLPSQDINDVFKPPETKSLTPARFKFNPIAEASSSTSDTTNSVFQKKSSAMPGAFTDEEAAKLASIRSKIFSKLPKAGTALLPYQIADKPADDLLFAGKMTASKKLEVKHITVDTVQTLFQALQQRPSEDQVAPQPTLIRTPLFEHQRHALAWMKWRESQKPCGGILADDMGLGKTLTMISLMAQSKADGFTPVEGVSTGIQSAATLVVAPASVMYTWKGEIEKHCDPLSPLSVYVFHGNNRENNARRLAKFDVVITSYTIIPREIANGEVKASDADLPPDELECDIHINKYSSVLQQIIWRRVILDEAHQIRNPKTKQSISCCRLRAVARWALSGTPVHNKLMDFFSLLRFLRCSPFDDKRTFESQLEKHVQKQKRIDLLVKALLLRRTKEDVDKSGKRLVPLPDKSFDCVLLDLLPYERKVYDKMFQSAQKVFKQFLADQQAKGYVGDAGAGPRMNNMSCLFVLILRLRQCCSHLMLATKGIAEEDLEEIEGSSATEDNLAETMSKMDISRDVIPNVGDDDSHHSAPDLKPPKQLMGKEFEIDFLSTKLRKLISCLEEILEKKEKCVIVSEWTSYLAIVAHHLERRGVSFFTIEGKVPLKDRDAAVQEFNSARGKYSVMLVSLKAGGVGLNLVGGNHLFLLDIHWNPALESQACDRVYRMGQTRNVHIHKFVCANTIDQKILAVQENKKGIAASVLSGAKAKSNKLSINDLKFIFDLK